MIKSIIYSFVSILFLLPNKIIGQVTNIADYEYKVVIAEDGALFHYKIQPIYHEPVISTMPVTGSKYESIFPLLPLIVDKGGRYPKDPFVNFGIYENNIFCLTYDNHKYRDVPFIENAPDAIVNYNKYYIELNPDKNQFIRAKGQRAYIHNNYKIKLDNYYDIATRKRPTFNYDFIILKDKVFLLLNLENDFYVYQARDVTNLQKSEWITKHCIKAPFEQEYFITTKNKEENLTIHTLTQGEFLLTDFQANPKLEKINEKTLGNRVFVEDHTTDSTYELTRTEYESMINSDDHLSKFKTL